MPKGRVEQVNDDAIYLRARALELAIKAAPVCASKTMTGAELMKEAEHIEAWLKQAQDG